MTTSFALYIFGFVFLMHIAIRDYVNAVNGNGFAYNFLALYILFCFFLTNIAIWDYVIAVNVNGFGDNFFCSVYFLLCFFNEYCDLGIRYCSKRQWIC